MVEIIDLVCDPGHGGADPGSVGPTTKEKDNALVLAKKTSAYLESTGRFRMKFTRDADKHFCSGAPYSENLDLKNRVAVANALDDKAFIFFHNNSAAVKAYGNEVYAAAAGGEGEKIAKVIYTRMASELGMVNRGVKFASWYVCKWTESIKLGNCAVFPRFADKTPPADVFKAEHLTIIGGSSVGHPNETILSGKTWGDTSAVVSGTGA